MAKWFGLGDEKEAPKEKQREHAVEAPDLPDTAKAEPVPPPDLPPPGSGIPAGGGSTADWSEMAAVPSSSGVPAGGGSTTDWTSMDLDSPPPLSGGIPPGGGRTTDWSLMGDESVPAASGVPGGGASTVDASLKNKGEKSEST